MTRLRDEEGVFGSAGKHSSKAAICRCWYPGLKSTFLVRKRVAPENNVIGLDFVAGASWDKLSFQVVILGSLASGVASYSRGVRWRLCCCSVMFLEVFECCPCMSCSWPATSFFRV